MADTFKIWPYKPLVNMVESLEWKTDIIEADDGNEQRIRVRIAPRQGFSVRVATDEKKHLSAIEMAISGWQSETFGIGCWHEQQRLASSLSSGAGTIAAPTSYADFREDSYALIWESLDKCEAVKIGTVGANLLTLADGVTVANDYAAGVRMMPLRIAEMSAQAMRFDYPGKLSIFDCDFLCTDNIELSTTTPTQYLGNDVFSSPSLFPSESIQRQIARSMYELDPYTGERATTARTDYPLISTGMRWRTESLQQSWEFRQWLHRRAGTLRPAWMPTRRDDLVIASPVSASNPVITVYDSIWRTLGVNQPTKQHVAIFNSNGSFVCRQIVSAEEGATGQESITLDSAIGFADVSRISFLSLHRFSSDRVELTWERPGVADVRASMVGVAQ